MILKNKSLTTFKLGHKCLFFPPKTESILFCVFYTMSLLDSYKSSHQEKKQFSGLLHLSPYKFSSYYLSQVDFQG